MSLEPRIIKGLQAEFTRAEWTGKNESGVRPLGTHVLVLMDPCAVASSGGVQLPEETLAKMNNASESGVVVAVGDAAFRYYDDGSRWTDYKPKAGDHVFVERYAGREIRGADGEVYRMMTYTCVGGLQDDATPQYYGVVHAEADKSKPPAKTHGWSGEFPAKTAKKSKSKKKG